MERYILAVDDERIVLDEIAEALGRHFSMEVETADSVAKAKELLESKIRQAGREAIAGIVSDIDFPVGHENGLHLAFYAARERIPFIFYTKTQPQLMAQVARAYNTVSVSKSDGVKALIAAIEERWRPNRH